MVNTERPEIVFPGALFLFRKDHIYNEILQDFRGPLAAVPHL